MASELELKLAACPSKLIKIKSLDFPAASSQSPWVESNIADTYFDNAAFKLRELCIGMRVRQINGEFIQCVKSQGKSIGGLHQRNEDESPVDSLAFAVDTIQDPYLQILVEEAMEEGGEFVACFQTDFVRTQSLLTFSDSTQIEVALDQGKIFSDDKEIAVCEVELELVQGSAEYVFAIGRYLIKELNLTLANASKARRGYSLCKKFNPRQKTMGVTELSQGVEAETAFEKICFNSLNHWQYYESFLDRDNAHGAILEMYRALMSLQHIYWVFGGLIPRSATKDLRRSWDWLAEAMRPIVDAAKHKRHLVRYLKLKADWDLVEDQQLKIQQEVTQRIEDFKQLLKTERYNLMMLNMSQWLYLKEWREHIPENDRESLSMPIIDFAKKQLDHMLKELRRDLGPKLELNIEDYAKQVSHLRRALDTGLFFGSLFDTQKRIHFRKPWKEITDGIRDMQMHQYIAELQTGEHTDEEIKQWLAEHNDPLLEKLKQLRTEAFKMNPYWS